MASIELIRLAGCMVERLTGFGRHRVVKTNETLLNLGIGRWKARLTWCRDMLRLIKVSRFRIFLRRNLPRFPQRSPVL
jgi:hypothetical protein